METPKLKIKKGDKVKGFFLSDFKESDSKNILDKIETVIDVTDDGGGYFLVTTDFTEKIAADIEKLNKDQSKEELKINTSWLINESNNILKIQNPVAPIDLSKIDGKVDGEFIVFEHIEIPLELIKSLSTFIDALEDKDIGEIFDIEEEIKISLSGIEFTPGMIKQLVN